ncbi:Transmembrane protein 135 [Eumeta japonica]|uniref:Transmembrane protein 135 n=1 Tax=Eumeta variegata TaxID=151549 RepID=A0A4C1Z5Y2_EUMVA|nr:Transmembrane protein 135 [Eumeta japonica]
MNAGCRHEKARLIVAFRLSRACERERRTSDLSSTPSADVSETLQRAGYLTMTTSKQTLLFMLGSAALFYLMRLEGDRKERTPFFWFFTPERVRRKGDDSKNVCPHDGPCWSHVLKGFLKLFGAGFAITFARTVLPNIRSPARALASLRPRHLRMAMFFGSYIGIYRAVVCLLCRRQGVDSPLHALPAGYLAGLSLYFSPSLGISIAAATGAFKLLSTILYEKKMITERIPLPEIIFCVCQGILYHARFMHPEVCPKYIFNLMSTVSNGCTEMLYDGMIESIKKPKRI